MARRIIPQSRFAGGLAYSDKEGLQSSFLWAQSVDYRSDPNKIKILPSTAKVSGNVVVDLVMDGDQYDATDSYFYGDAGHIYRRTSSEVWTDLRTAPNSHANGMKYYGEDGYLYYTSDNVIGRYGPMNGEKSFADDFLGAQGGVPLNTHSLDLELSSSMYATAADDATNSITGDITIEGYFKMESLPAAAAQMVLVSKWDKNNDDRSYMFDLAGVSARFGDGGDGALTIAADTTQAPTDSACTGTAAAYSLSATNASFTVGDRLLIHQSRGTNAGNLERNEIASYTAGTITLSNALSNTYTSGAQVIVLPEYTNVTVDSGKTWTAKAWNGTVGGILTFLANGTVTVTGTITATGKGFRGGNNGESRGYQGEGTSGFGSNVAPANGNGGGGGGNDPQASGGGISGSADLTSMTFGGGGGGGSYDPGYAGGQSYGKGGVGGGVVFFYGATVTVTGVVSAVGATGGNAYPIDPGVAAGGGGGGGSVLYKSQIATLGTVLTTAIAGNGGTSGGRGHPGAGGGNGAVGDDGVYGGSPGGGTGRIHLDYYTSYSGTTTPALDVTQDDSLASSTTYQLRFSVSSDGTSSNEEVLSKTITDPQTAQWYHYAVRWDASDAEVEFFINGVSQGTATGAKTAISDNASLFAIGASLDAASDDENHFDGKVDEIRLWSDLRTDAEIENNREAEISGGEANLAAYYQVDNSTGDSSANSNTLTLVNSPTYDAEDVPFSSPSTRQDLDQSLDTAGDTYALTTTIDEGATHRQTFVPTKEPLKSIAVLLAAKGTGDWTLTLHDALNREIGTRTITNGNLLAAAGDVEFIFSSPLRIILGASYHFHITSTVADATITSTGSDDLETADFHTYFSFLVDDVFHPIEQIVNKLAIGNERYVATFDATTYTPHAVTLPSGYRIRCLGHWREYLAIGTTRGTNLESYDQGRIFFWDGIATTYNFYVDVPEGGVNSILGGDPMYFVAGYSGDFMEYAGGLPKKILRIPKVETTDTLEINRKALSMYRALVHIGMAENSTSTTIERGVYSYGSLDRGLAKTISFDYPLSLGITTGATLEIGLLLPIETALFIGWRNGSSYGVDSVNPSNNPFTTAKIEFLITDANKIWAEKQAQVLRTYFKKLVSGDSITMKYKIDRESLWQRGTAETTADKITSRLPLPTKANRFNELQVGIDLETTGSVSPEIYGWAVDIDEMQRERRT